MMFLPMPVILFTGVGEGGWLPSMHHKSHDHHPGGGVGFPACITGHMTGSLHPGGLHPGGGGSVSRWRGGLHPGRGRGLHPGRGTGVCIQGASASRDGLSAYRGVGQKSPPPHRNWERILLEWFLVRNFNVK